MVIFPVFTLLWYNADEQVFLRRAYLGRCVELNWWNSVFLKTIHTGLRVQWKRAYTEKKKERERERKIHGGDEEKENRRNAQENITWNQLRLSFGDLIFWVSFFEGIKNGLAIIFLLVLKGNLGQKSAAISHVVNPLELHISNLSDTVVGSI